MKWTHYLLHLLRRMFSLRSDLIRQITTLSFFPKNTHHQCSRRDSAAVNNKSPGGILIFSCFPSFLLLAFPVLHQENTSTGEDPRYESRLQQQHPDLINGCPQPEESTITKVQIIVTKPPAPFYNKRKNQPLLHLQCNPRVNLLLFNTDVLRDDS